MAALAKLERSEALLGFLKERVETLSLLLEQKNVQVKERRYITHPPTHLPTYLCLPGFPQGKGGNPLSPPRAKRGAGKERR